VINASSFYDCGAGATFKGQRSAVNGCTFKRCDRAILDGGSDIAYQGFIQTTAYGLRGDNAVSSCLFENEAPLDAAKAAVDVNPGAFFTLSGNVTKGNGLYAITVANAAYPTIENNQSTARFWVKGCTGAVVKNNSVSGPAQNAFMLESCAKLFFDSNSILFARAAFGGGHGVVYTSCTDATISNTRTVGVAGDPVHDGGGNATVTVSGTASY
jgi:hypothetical protein